MSIYGLQMRAAAQAEDAVTTTAHATLALANEQRLANMIAWYHVIPESDRGRKLREQIEQELGL